MNREKDDKVQKEGSETDEVLKQVDLVVDTDCDFLTSYMPIEAFFQQK